jgi:hypothetical protein
MSRTHKKLKWWRNARVGNDNRWRGIKQNHRDKLRYKLRYRDRLRNEKRDNQGWVVDHILNVLISRGHSLEEIRRRLLKHCSGYAADELINDRIPNTMIVTISGLTCVDDDKRLIPVSTMDCDPWFLISVNLPIYCREEIAVYNGVHSDRSPWWDGGLLVYMNDELWKFDVTDEFEGGVPKHKFIWDGLSGRLNGNSHEYLSHYCLKVWPNQRVTSIIGDLIHQHVEEGMLDLIYKAYGWKNLHYSVTKS